ncbi:MAG TPA: hypothetical protein VNE18_10410 [Rhodanobacter sp.]|nr:hypothetical protein [Rhodanobacter sp.]
MQALVLAQDVAFGAAAVAAVELTATPFYPGRQVVGVITLSSDTAGAAGVIKIQSSPDNATWTDQLVAAAGPHGDTIGNVATDTYMRANQTVAYTAGKFSAYLLGGV